MSMSGAEASRGSVDSTTAVPLQLNPSTVSFMARKRDRPQENKGESEQANKKQKIHTDEVRLHKMKQSHSSSFFHRQVAMKLPTLRILYVGVESTYPMR